MNGKQLKNSILQWAIQGKLVPQDPNDEPASVLLEKIRQEKERLIMEKKIKRDKNASIIYRGEDNSEYPSFECLEDFLAALEETIYRYHDTRSTIAEHWSEKVCNAYKAYYGKTLNIPRWNDIKSKYIKEKTEE